MLLALEVGVTKMFFVAFSPVEMVPKRLILLKTISDAGFRNLLFDEEIYIYILYYIFRDYVYIYLLCIICIYIYIYLFFIHMKLEYKFHGRFSLALHCAFLLFFTINSEKLWHTDVPAVILRLGGGEEIHMLIVF